MRINISSNFEEVAAKFDALNTEMMDATQPLRAFGAIMQKDIGDQFESEGGAFGDEPWPPIKMKSLMERKTSTVKKTVGGEMGGYTYRTRKKGAGKNTVNYDGYALGGYKILRDEGILFGSIRQLDLTPRSVTIGTDDIRANTHNYGDITRNIPKRQFIPEYLSEEEEAQLMQLFESWMQDAIGRSGLT